MTHACINFPNTKIHIIYTKQNQTIDSENKLIAAKGRGDRKNTSICGKIIKTSRGMENTNFRTDYF